MISAGSPADRSRQRMLLIAYHFPPSSAVGGMRAANFARSLVTFGWEPHVLTIRDCDVQYLDHDRRQGLDGIAVHHARVLSTVERVYERWRKGQQRPAERAPVRDGTRSMPAQRVARRESLVGRFKRYVLAFLALPDRERGWVLPASSAAIRLMRRGGIDWFMTSCPPYSVHVIGLIVKAMTGKRWVADYRDPWMTTGSKRLFPTCRLSIRIESWLERKVVEHADLLLFNVERLRNAYRTRYSHVAGEKFAFIPNAVSPPQSAKADRLSKYDAFTLVYTGSLYVGRSPEPVFAAIAQLIREGRVSASAIRVLLVGQCREIDGVPISEVARRYQLERSVEVRDAVSHDEAMTMVRRSHLALLLAPNLPFQIPAKVYDYLAAGTRILAIAEDGGTADLIAETKAGSAFSPTAIGDIADFIHAELTGQLSAKPTAAHHATALQRFDIRRLTEELVGHLDRVGAMSGAAT